MLSAGTRPVLSSGSTDKSNKLSGLNNKAYISCSYGNWKSKVKVGLILGEILFLAYQVAPSYQVSFLVEIEERERGRRDLMCLPLPVRALIISLGPYHHVFI